MVAAVIQLIVVLVVVVIAWTLPGVVRPTAQFGVRLPAGHGADAVVRDWRRTFRLGVLALGVVAAAVSAGAAAARLPLLAVGTVVALVLAYGLLYYLAHRAVRTAVNGGWTTDQSSGSAAGPSRHPDPVRFPWSWTLPALLVIAATAAFGVRRYPHLPDELVLHHDASGGPGRVVDTTPLSAFSPVLTQVALTVLIFGSTALMLRTRWDVDVTDPVRGGRQSRSSIAVAQAVLNLAAFADLSAFFVALQLWGVWKSVGATAVAGTASSAVGILGLVLVAARASQSGRRRPAGDAPSTTLRQRDDDRYWRGGLLYVNRDDPALMVPKRLGIGWTLNFGHPISWFLFALAVSTPLVVSVLLAWLAR